jgi:hypothetical protein
MTIDQAAQAILSQYERLAQTGTLTSRARMVSATGLGWGRFLEAHAYMVKHLLVPNKLAIRYDPRTRLWTAGAERFNGAAGYDESKDFIAWHGRYLRTRLDTSDTHLEATNQAFPSQRRTLRPGTIHRYLSNAIAELDDAMARL